MSKDTLIQQKTAGMLSEHHAGLPVWIRAPKQGGVDLYCGLTRSKLYELAGRGLIRSVSLKEPHQIRGTRLFNLPSIFLFIESKSEATQSERYEQLQALAADPNPDVSEPARADIYREFGGRDDVE